MKKYILILIAILLGVPILANAYTLRDIVYGGGGRTLISTSTVQFSSNGLFKVNNDILFQGDSSAVGGNVFIDAGPSPFDKCIIATYNSRVSHTLDLCFSPNSTQTTYIGGIGIGLVFGANATSSFYINKTSNYAGFGTSTPFAPLSVQASVATSSPIFDVATSTGSSVWDILGNNHVRTTGPRPTLGSCGTSPSIKGNDMNFHVTAGSILTTSCLINFASSFKYVPVCSLTQESGTSLTFLPVAAPTVSGITISGGTFTGDQFGVHCEEPNE